MKKIAVLILNRNLPKVTENLYYNIKKNNKNLVDIFVIDSGSLKKIFQNLQPGKLIGKVREIKV